MAHQVVEKAEKPVICVNFHVPLPGKLSFIGPNLLNVYQYAKAQRGELACKFSVKRNNATKKAGGKRKIVERGITLEPVFGFAK